MVGIAACQRIGHPGQQSAVIRVRYVVHVAFGGLQADAVLIDDVDPLVVVVEPDRCRLAGDVQDHPDAGRVHFVHDRIKADEVEPPLGRLEIVPGQIAHPHHIESGPAHQRDVVVNLRRASIDRLVVGPDEQAAVGHGEGRSGGDGLCAGCAGLGP